jgi:hypothetical protein
VIDADAVENAPAPSELMAATLNVYAVPRVRDVIVSVVDVDADREKVVYVVPFVEY